MSVKDTFIPTALEVVFDNSNSDLVSTNVEEAIKEVANSSQSVIDTFPGAILYQASALPGDIQGIPNWEVNSSGGITQTAPQVADDGGYKQLNSWFANIDNDVESLNEVLTLHYNRANMDFLNKNNAFGTNGTAFQFIANDFYLNNETDIGRVEFITNTFELGQNGAGPINVGGFSYSFGFGQVRDNVTINNGGIQGYGFQPFFEAGSEVNTFTSAFYDAMNAPNTLFEFYTSFNASPTLGGIKNNFNLNLININPSIGEFFGNSGATVIGLFGNYGNFGATGYFQALNISPTIGVVPNADYLTISPTQAGGTNATVLTVNSSNVTADNVTAARFIGNVEISGNLSFGGSLSTGQLNAFYQTTFTDNGFVPATMHGLVTGIQAPDSAITLNADNIGVNTAALMQFLENSTTSSGPFSLGACALAAPAVVYTELGSTVDYVRGAVYAINLDNTSTGGTIQNAVACRAVAVPNGVTAVNKYIAYEADLPFGILNSNDSFGFFCSANIHNWMRGSLCVGGTQEKVSNSSIGIEIVSTTKAFGNSEMTTTQRDALTPKNGMQIYNVTTEKLQVYSAGSWVDLH